MSVKEGTMPTKRPTGLRKCTGCGQMRVLDLIGWCTECCQEEADHDRDFDESDIERMRD